MSKTRTSAAETHKLRTGTFLSFRLRPAEKPREKKTSAAAKAIVTALVRKSNAAPPATSQRIRAIPMPTVASGGINAVAIATPGSVAERFLRVIAYAAARPPDSAMIRSIGVGRVRAITSPGSSCNETKGRKRLTSAIANDSNTARSAPRMSVPAAVRSSLSSPVTDARPSPMIGDMSGATSIAPMMTAAELVIKPDVAIAQDNTTSNRKSKQSLDDSASSALISWRSSVVSGFTILRKDVSTLIGLLADPSIILHAYFV